MRQGDGRAARKPGAATGEGGERALAALLAEPPGRLKGRKAGTPWRPRGEADLPDKGETDFRRNNNGKLLNRKTGNKATM